MLQGKATEQAPGHAGGHRPLGRDHPRPRRRVRRRRARDPDPGRRPDRRRAAGRRGPRAGRQRPDQARRSSSSSTFERTSSNPDGQPSLYEAAQLAAADEAGRRRAGLPTYYAFDKRRRSEALAGPRARPRHPATSLPRTTRSRRASRSGGPEGPVPGLRGGPALPDARVGHRAAPGTSSRTTRGSPASDITRGARHHRDRRASAAADRIVTIQFTGRRPAEVRRTSPASSPWTGNLAEAAPALRDHPRRQDRLQPDGRLQRLPGRDRRAQRRPDRGRLQPGRGRDPRQADQLRRPADPAEVISQKQVSATLGKQSLRQALIAGIVGLAPGDAVPDRLLPLPRASSRRSALIVYAVLLYAVVVLVPITLTLPGIAGIILTIGVASDANVVIFERVREEARAGKSPRAAILAGYKKGITRDHRRQRRHVGDRRDPVPVRDRRREGLRLHAVRSASLLSLFTAVVATRAVFNVLAETRFLRDDRYMGLNQREIRWKIDFVGKWKLWMAISFVPLAIGAVYIGVNGLNLGLDFESGTRVETLLRAARRRRTGCAHVSSDLGLERRQDPGHHRAGRRPRRSAGFQIQTETLQPPAAPGAAARRSTRVRPAGRTTSRR